MFRLTRCRTKACRALTRATVPGATKLLDVPASRILLTRDEGQILEIRPFVISDAPKIVEAVNESLKELREFMPWAHYPQTDENQRARVAGLFESYWKGGDMSLGIFSGDRMLGGTGLHDRTLNSKGKEIGYWCRTSEAGKGVITASTQALIVYGFEYLGLTRIQCGHDTANVGSATVNDRCGFKVHGTFKNFISAPSAKMVEDGYKGTGDCVMRGLTPEDIPGLAWYPDVKRRLKVYDWLGALAVAGALSGCGAGPQRTVRFNAHVTNFAKSSIHLEAHVESDTASADVPSGGTGSAEAAHKSSGDEIDFSATMTAGGDAAAKVFHVLVDAPSYHDCEPNKLRVVSNVATRDLTPAQYASQGSQRLSSFVADDGVSYLPDLRDLASKDGWAAVKRTDSSYGIYVGLPDGETLDHVAVSNDGFRCADVPAVDGWIAVTGTIDQTDARLGGRYESGTSEDSSLAVTFLCNDVRCDLSDATRD